MPRSQNRPKRLLHQEPAAVAQARNARNITQAALAEAVGLRVQSIAGFEAGRRSAHPDVLARIAQALTCPVELLERRRPLSCEVCGFGFDPPSNGLTPVHTSKTTGDWCVHSNEPVQQVERAVA